jgi:sugar phosphate isomerase/epimerase
MTAQATKPLRIGCQTFTWEMLGDAWRGTTDDLLSAISRAGYAGIEITNMMIGAYRNRPDAFGAALRHHDLLLVAYACGSASGYTEASALARDLDAAERAIAFAAHFDDAHVSFGSATIVSEGPRANKFSIAAEFYNAAGEHGSRAGVSVAVHPSSHHNTLLFSRADYDQMFALLEPDRVGWIPDTGHILRGGQDLLDTLRRYRDRIRYLHLKDVDQDGQWQMLGAGICETRSVIDAVRSAPNFNGWLVLEEESPQARRDPAGAIEQNRETIRHYEV